MNLKENCPEEKLSKFSTKYIQGRNYLHFHVGELYQFVNLTKFIFFIIRQKYQMVLAFTVLNSQSRLTSSKGANKHAPLIENAFNNPNSIPQRIFRQVPVQIISPNM
jgi:hypothetical protein